MQYDTKKDACYAWVETFDRIPMGIIDKLAESKDEIVEITPPAVGDTVYIYSGPYDGCYAEITKTITDTSPHRYEVDVWDRVNSKTIKTLVFEDEFDVEHDDRFPAWGWMWAFSDQIDNDWLSGEFGKDGLQLMANCGFRIYEQEDYGYIFGIDGAGYDFYEAHWIPLYDARGLHWHKEPES